ncbi:MAG: SWIM zinc finger family protein [Pseudomonadota bacterium]
MVKKINKIEFFKNLSWDDLREWAGSKIVSRGKDYQKSGYVEDLAFTPDGALIAWVLGTHRYATLVDVQKGKLISDCNCPYGDTCKHAVAVVLEGLDFLNKKKEISPCSDGDKRLQALDDFELDDEWEEEEWDNDWKKEPKKHRPIQISSGSKTKSSQSFSTFLEGRTKTQLIDLIQELANSLPEIRQALEDRQALSTGTVNKMVQSIRNEIDELSSEPGWRHHWNNEGYTPDYSRVQERLEALLNQGYADEVVSLGKELLKAGTNQVGMSNDDGETAMEISSCLDVVFRALPKSSLSPFQQMLWAIEVELKDEYDLCQDLEHFWKQRFNKEDWSKLADTLLERLSKRSFGKKQDPFSRDYSRDHLTNRIIDALQKAGRQKEIIPLCEQEVEETGNYSRLVKRLVEANRLKEAEQWIHRGYKATLKKWPGIADQLRNILIGIREKEGNRLQVAAFKAENFFYEPTLHTFQELQKAAQKAKVWPEVEAAARQYLETGNRFQKSKTWPLPNCEIPLTEPRRKQEFPILDTLIDIAISEKDPEKILYWYDQQKPKRLNWGWGLDSSQDVQVAKAVVDQYPDRAIAIWKKIAENLIAETKPKSYEAAAPYLRKIQKTLKNLNKEKNWQTYTKELRQKNIRKIRFIEILDSLAGRSIIEGLK